MNTTTPPEDNPTKDLKFYSAGSIHRGTFLGGPIIAGYLISENYKALEKYREAKIALCLGISVTIALFAFLFLLPESLMEKFPNFLLPLIYTGITALIVERTMGRMLFKHKEHNNSFYSVWRVVGISVIPLLIFFGGILGYYYLSPEREIEAHYDSQLATFADNEEESLAFFEHLNTKTPSALIEELDNMVIPNWQENKLIMEQAHQLKSLDDNIKQQNAILLEYCNLRLRSFNLIRKSLEEDTDLYSFEIKLVKSKIQAKLKELKSI
ncbi:MAG: hypothetical protein WBL27_00640 [Salinimicrobium sp.]